MGMLFYSKEIMRKIRRSLAFSIHERSRFFPIARHLRGVGNGKKTVEKASEMFFRLKVLSCRVVSNIQVCALFQAYGAFFQCYLGRP